MGPRNQEEKKLINKLKNKVMEIRESDISTKLTKGQEMVIFK